MLISVGSAVWPQARGGYASQHLVLRAIPSARPPQSSRTNSGGLVSRSTAVYYTAVLTAQQCQPACLGRTTAVVGERRALRCVELIGSVSERQLRLRTLCLVTHRQYVRLHDLEPGYYEIETVAHAPHEIDGVGTAVLSFISMPQVPAPSPCECVRDALLRFRAASAPLRSLLPLPAASLCHCCDG